MKIGLIDVDGHHYPNLTLMKISAWHKARGDTVEWWWSDLFHYDVVYMSKVFSDTYTPDQPEPLNAGQVIKGGTGYAITLENGLEVYHPERDKPLPPEIEHILNLSLQVIPVLSPHPRLASTLDPRWPAAYQPLYMGLSALTAQRPPATGLVYWRIFQVENCFFCPLP